MPNRSRTRRTGGVRTGGRSARVVEAALAATVEELGRVGYTALRVEDIAAKCEVNKTTLYRRWPTKLDLVSDAVRHQWTDVTVAETGDIRADLVTMLLHAVEHFLCSERVGLMRVFYAEHANPEVSQLGNRLREEHRAPRIALLRRAIDRGDLAPDSDPELILEVLMGTVYGRTTRFGIVSDRAYVERLIDLVLDGARNRARP